MHENRLLRVKENCLRFNTLLEACKLGTGSQALIGLEARNIRPKFTQM